MKRCGLIVGLLVMLAAFALTQNRDQNSTTTTTQTTTTTTQTKSGQKTAPPSADVPAGTVVTHERTETIVQPAAKPVKVDASTIKAAQEALANKGYNPGPADGVLGPKTRAALRKFQADEGNPVTGRLDQKTLAALNVAGKAELGAAPSDIGRGGKAAGHNIKGGHPVAAGKAVGKGTANAAKKVGQGVESGASTMKDKIGGAVSSVGEKITGNEKNKSEQNQNKTTETVPK
ncbi:MAG: peptidoglycan-binding protein [Terriglobales bacterium]